MTYNQFLQKLQKAAKGTATQLELDELWAYQCENEIDLNADELALITPNLNIVAIDIKPISKSGISTFKYKPEKIKDMLYGTKLMVEEADSIIILPNLESVSDSNIQRIYESDVDFLRSIALPNLESVSDSNIENCEDIIE